MRKRKLYLSELLKRNKNKELVIVITYKNGMFTTDKNALIENNLMLNEEVKEWIITHSKLTETLHIKL